MADTSLLLPALLSPHGMRRKLLVLFAYGAYSCYERVGLDELDLVREIEVREGHSSGGADIEELVPRVREHKSRLADRLPPMAPDDLCLTGCRMLFDEVERKVAEVGARIARGLGPDAPQKYRRQLEAITASIVPPFNLDEVPLHTADRNDDFVIETALRARAHAIVSDDRKHIALSADVPTRYTDPRSGEAVGAYQLQPFIEDQVNTLHFDLADIDGSLLELAVSPLT